MSDEPATALGDDAADATAGVAVAPVVALLLSDGQAAAALGISRAHFRNLDRKGLIPRGLSLGRCRRWSAAELASWAAAGAPDRLTWQARNGQ